MNKTSSSIVMAVLVAVVSIVLFYFGLQKVRPPAVQVSAPLVEAKPGPTVNAEPLIRFPLKVEEKLLPPLAGSDSAMRETMNIRLGSVFGTLVNWHDIVRRIVATVDNLPRQKLAPRLLPLRPVPGPFAVSGMEGAEVIAPRNYERYAPYVVLAQAVDTRKLIAVYLHFYPLFQEAYRELGYPHGYFNDRVIEVIDSMLAAPEVKTPLRLVRPKVYYEFSDANLESLPAGQKILIRIGAQNAAKIKAKLRELRGALTSLSP